MSLDSSCGRSWLWKVIEYFNFFLWMKKVDTDLKARINRQSCKRQGGDFQSSMWVNWISWHDVTSSKKVEREFCPKWPSPREILRAWNFECCRRDNKRLNHSTSKAEKKSRMLPIFWTSLPLDKVGWSLSRWNIWFWSGVEWFCFSWNWKTIGKIGEHWYETRSSSVNRNNHRLVSCNSPFQALYDLSRFQHTQHHIRVNVTANEPMHFVWSFSKPKEKQTGITEILGSSMCSLSQVGMGRL